MNVATIHRFPSFRGLAASPQRGLVEVATLVGLYGLYEVVRGQGHATLGAAREHTDGIVALERHLHLFGERAIQRGAHWIPGLPTVLGVAYIALHFLGTAVFLVSHSAKVNLSSDLLGSLYNPFAAVPSLHFGYALLVGVTIAALAPGRLARAIGWTYPVVMMIVIVATGNHFFFDAAGGAIAIAIGYLFARQIESPATPARCRRAGQESAVAMS